jgi:hypothetical protein
LDPALQEARLLTKVKECRETKFYGEVTLFIQAGNLVRFETRHVERLEPDGVSDDVSQTDSQQVQEEVALPQQAGEAG